MVILGLDFLHHVALENPKKNTEMIISWLVVPCQLYVHGHAGNIGSHWWHDDGTVVVSINMWVMGEVISTSAQCK
jgi:hypothetical protein